jgi:hypothetical protein
MESQPQPLPTLADSWNGVAESTEIRETAQHGTGADVDPRQKATEDFLEPLAFHWSEDEYAASQAARTFCAELYADP